MFPSLLLFHSDLSWYVITARRRMIHAARKNAEAVHRRGAMYPWQSGATGLELYCSVSIFYVSEIKQIQSLNSAYYMHNNLCFKIMRYLCRLDIYL